MDRSTVAPPDPESPRGVGPRPDRAALPDAAPAAVPPLVLPGPRVRAKLAAGTPLLHGEAVVIDPAGVRATWERLLDALEREPDRAPAATAVRAALLAHRLHAEQATTEALASHPEHVAELARMAGTPPDVVLPLAALSARPILAAYARQLAPALALGRWERPYCPICGAWPAEVEPAEARGAARGRCGRCATAWGLASDAVPRIEGAGASGDGAYAPPPGAGFRLELAGGEAGEEWEDDLDD